MDRREGGYSRDGGKQPYRKNNGFGGGYSPYDKDKDEDVKPVRRATSVKDSKPKEAQPDKSQVQSRIEKEKKAMQKKQAERKNARPNRQMARPKRTNNIDWTSIYENGEYDEDEFDAYL